jgi:hypothetical protein
MNNKNTKQRRHNSLTATITVNGLKCKLSCCKVDEKYMWFTNEGVAAVDELSDSLDDAKNALVATYPPRRFNMRASWLSAGC